MAKLERATRLSAPERAVVDRVMHAVVQIVALRQGFLGQMSPAWTGSGTIIDPSGLVLTNCHVANPRAMGMSAPQANVLAIAITQRSDEAPALTYVAKIAAQSPEVDLAVLRIVSGLNGQAVSNLNLPYVPVGDSDQLELGDTLSIFGFPGIGGETVTYTSGSVAGFTSQSGLRDRRAWIKTDATIAGGNSGGTAVNDRGELVGVPTQAAAGANITPVDARPVVDTNKDGRVDEHDTPMAVGGFINGLRPVNLAKPLLQQAGMGQIGAQPEQQPYVPQEVAPAQTGAVRFSALVFSRQVTQEGLPINPAAILPSGGTDIYATFEFEGMQNGVQWGQVWTKDSQTIVSQQDAWRDGERGRKVMVLSNQSGLPDGRYHLILTLGNQVASEGEVAVGRQAEDTDTQVSGQVVDSRNNRGISGVLVLALKPGVSTQQFVQTQDRTMIYSAAQTDANGQFTFPQQLPKGQAYGLVVVARGYQDLAIESALRVNANAPEQAQLNPIPLQPD